MYFTQRKWRLNCVHGNPPYLGQPSAGFFFCMDFFTASCQVSLIFKTSGLGPGFAPDLAAGVRFTAFFVAI
jgi:hypothetical protein